MFGLWNVTKDSLSNVASMSHYQIRRKLETLAIDSWNDTWKKNLSLLKAIREFYEAMIIHQNEFQWNELLGYTQIVGEVFPVLRNIISWKPYVLDAMNRVYTFRNNEAGMTVNKVSICDCLLLASIVGVIFSSK